MSVMGGSTIVYYPVTHNYPYLFRAFSNAEIGFTPNGKSIVGPFAREGICIWNLPGEDQIDRRSLWKNDLEHMNLDPTGKYLLLSTSGEGVHLVSLSDGKDLSLKGKDLDHVYGSVAFSADGKSIA